jgi:cobalt/nickel transport system permease protein
MHIPDGYLSPQTYVPLYATFLAFMAVAIKKLKKKLTAHLVPYLGMAAAFAFLIMMFNIPVPGGTAGHAVGAALIALILGPWIAVVAVSIAVIIQAFIFGDGGITAIGANCFNMAIAMPFIAYGCFRLINGNSESTGRTNIAAFLAGYLSLCLTSLITAVELGIQPIIATAPDGSPLYAPYPLKIAIPAMAIEHFLIFGIAEGLITALLFRYFFNANRELIYVLQRKP